MTEVSISLTENGRDSTLLSAIVGNDLQVKWQLTDQQLTLLAARAISIIQSRARSKVLNAEGLRYEIIKALEE